MRYSVGAFLGLLTTFVAASVFVVLSPRSAFAQGGETGSIVGFVIDQNSMPIKGVKVVAKSSTQIGGNKTTYSDDEGAFRFKGLLPGTFEIVASAPKMKTINQRDIRVGVNVSAEATIIMEIETSAVEEVKVVEKAPIVSTTSAVVKEVYDEEFMDNLPLETRTSVEHFVGNNVAGSRSISNRSARIRGGTSEQNAFMVDGFFMNGQKTTFKSLAAMEVQTAGVGADGATSPGGVITMVTKSGSNKYEIDVNGFWEDSVFKPFRDEGESEQRGWRIALNPTLSGPIIKDRLWFFVNIESRSEVNARESDPTGFFSQPPRLSYGNVRGTLKLTWQMTPRNKLQSFTIINRDFAKNLGDGLNVDRDAQSKFDHFDGFSGLTWESAPRNDLVLTLKGALTRFWEETAPESCRLNPDSCDHTPAIVQTFPQTIFLGNYSIHQQIVKKSVELAGQLEYFATTKNLGSHNIKLAPRYFSTTEEIADSTPGDKIIYWNGSVNARQVEYFSNDPRLQPQRYGWFLRTGTGTKVVTPLTDSIRATRYLTLNPGVAFVWAFSENSAGERVTDDKALTQHLSTAYDLTHDGRTALRASFNSYVDPDSGRLARFSLGDRVSRDCNWVEATKSYADSCTFSGGKGNNTFGLPCGKQGVDIYGNDCREKLKLPRTWEYTVGAEREIIQGVGVGGDFIYRLFTTPYTNRETNRVWNNSGSELDRTSPYRNGVAQIVTDLGTPENAERIYKGVTLNVHKRDGVFKVNAAYTWSHLTGNAFDTNSGYGLGSIPPRDQFLYGDLPDDARHNVRVTGNYQATKWLTFGMVYRYTSGYPYTKYFYNVQTGGRDDLRARVGLNPGNDINDPKDDRPLRMPDTTQFNVSIRANLKPLTGTQTEFFVDVINVFNLRETTGVVTEDGPRFGQTSARQSTTLFRLGFRFKY